MAAISKILERIKIIPATKKSDGGGAGRLFGADYRDQRSQTPQAIAVNMVLDRDLFEVLISVTRAMLSNNFEL
jgi:hypothetical protein